jgi:hypothetical protein
MLTSEFPSADPLSKNPLTSKGRIFYRLALISKEITQKHIVPGSTEDYLLGSLTTNLLMAAKVEMTDKEVALAQELGKLVGQLPTSSR